MQPNEQVGRRIALLRDKKGILQQEAADHLHITRGSFAMKECGIRSFNLEEIIALANLLEVTTDEILRGIRAENTTINADTGLNDTAVDALKRFKKESPQMLPDLCRALSSYPLLNALAGYMGIPVKEPGFYSGASYDVSDEFIKAELSPDTYAALEGLVIQNILTQLRTGQPIPEYAPYKQTLEEGREKLAEEGRILKGGAQNAAKE